MDGDESKSTIDVYMCMAAGGIFFEREYATVIRYANYCCDGDGDLPNRKPVAIYVLEHIILYQ